MILDKKVDESQNISWWTRLVKEMKRPDTSIIKILKIEYEEVSTNEDNTWYQAMLSLKIEQ